MVTENATPPNYLASPLDPADWPTFRSQAHCLLDSCIDHLADVRNRPWRPLSDADCASLSLGDPAEG